MSSGTQVKDYKWIVKAAGTGAIFSAANATIVPDGSFSLAQGGLSALSDVGASMVSSWISGYVSDPVMRPKLEQYLFTPLASGMIYVLLAKCLTKQDTRKWMMPFLVQGGSSAASAGLMEYTPLGTVGSGQKL